ncbi:MAG TPA: hypothetical protein VIR98_00155 [Candidatus Paceibacterota bacterium]
MSSDVVSNALAMVLTAQLKTLAYFVLMDQFLSTSYHRNRLRAI